MVCGSPLDYLDQTEKMVCTFCGKQEQGNIKCPRGHFVCDTCHNKDAVKIIEDIALTTELPDRDGILCSYSRKHPHGCREDNCPYFKSGSGRSSDNETNRSGKVSLLLKKAVEFGAEQAKIIDTKTVIVEEWVRWKCQYGCPLYEKDALHPPVSPDAERAKKVMKEYKTAILLTSAKGKELTDVAVNLEREAYHEGFYKAFALTALAPGSSGAT